MAACTQQAPGNLNIEFIQPHDLAKHLHTDNEYVLLDCRPVLAYNSCHISGAVNVNFTGMMKKRFMAGKIGLADLVTTEEGRKRFKTLTAHRTVVYDEDTTTIETLTSSNSVYLVVSCLVGMGQMPYLLEGGLSQFGTLHPSLCEISVPLARSYSSFPPPIRASTPGMRDQALDWQTAPPVHVLSFLVLGSERDAKSDEVFDWFNIRYVLNVTPTCPNHFEDKGVVYKRIAVSDTGTQKLSNQFQDVFDFIEKARKDNKVILIHCMAGISRSVTLTIAYIMAFFNHSMQDAYQFVKEKRPAISPNLNFMGQLVEFERYCRENGPRDNRDIEKYVPTRQQREISQRLMEKIARSGSTASLTGKPFFEHKKSIDGGVGGPGVVGTDVNSNPPTVPPTKPFVLKALNPKSRRQKKLKDISVDNTTLSNNSTENVQPQTHTSTNTNSVDNTKDIPPPTTVQSESTCKASTTKSMSILPGPSLEDKIDRNSPQSPPRSGSPRPKSPRPKSPRPKSPRQVVVLSVKGERLNLQHREAGGRSPSPSLTTEGSS